MHSSQVHLLASPLPTMTDQITTPHPLILTLIFSMKLKFYKKYCESDDFFD